MTERRIHSSFISAGLVFSVVWLMLGAGSEFALAQADPDSVSDEAASTAVATSAETTAEDRTTEGAYAAVEGYIARVTGSEVNIRSGPAQVYYPVGKLQKGQRVLVRQEMFGLWAKIEPPIQSFSYIAKEFVTLEGSIGLIEGKPIRGVVTGENVRVRAGSTGTVKPANADEVQTKLSSGHEVWVLGVRDAYYKIVPPPGCYFYTSINFLDRVGPLTKADLALHRMKLQREVIQTILDSSEMVVEDAPESVRFTEATPLSEREAFLKLEQRFRDEAAKPIAQRDFVQIKKELAELTQKSLNPEIKTAGQILEQQVRRANLVVSTWKRSKEQDRNLQGVLGQIRQQMQYIAAAESMNRSEDGEVMMTGRLEPSALFPPGSSQRRFLLLDESGKIAYYAVSGRNGLDLAEYTGKLVSVMGPSRFDSFSHSRILAVRNLIEVPVAE